MPSPDAIRIISVIAFIILMILGLKKSVWLVIAYMILVYCKLSSYYPVFATMKSELVFALLIILKLLISGELRNIFLLSTNKVNQYLFFFILSIFLSFAVSWNHQHSWDVRVYHFIKVLILYVMLLGGVSDKKDLRIFIIGFMIMFAYLAYEPTYYFISGSGGSVQMYGTNYISEIGLLSGHVALANNMNQMIPIALFAFLGLKQKLLKWAALACLIIFVLALIGSGSRGGAAGFAFLGLTVIYFSKNRMKAIILVGIPLSILLITSGRMSSTISRIDTDSFWGRLIGLTHGIGMLQRGNILGVGPGCYQIARKQYFGWGMQSHNIYGQVIGDLGIPGSIAWGLFVYNIFNNLTYVRQKLAAEENQENFLYSLALGVQISLLVRLFISFASHGLYYFYWYIMAFISILIRKIVDESYPEQIQMPKRETISQ